MKARIQIVSPDVNTPSNFFNENGKLFLDLPEGFSFPLTKTAVEYSEIGGLKRGEASASFALPKTPKNVWILRRFIYPNRKDPDLTGMAILAIDGSNILAEDQLKVIRTDGPSKTIEVGLFESAGSSWYEGAEELLINQIDFGTFTLNETNLQTNRELSWAWEEGSAMHRWPLVHYGAWLYDDGAWPEDLRPVLSVLATVKEGFCALGWTVETPLETVDWFKKQWWYGLDDQYYQTSGYGAAYNLIVESATDETYVAGEVTIETGTVILDSGSNWVPTGGGDPFPTNRYEIDIDNPKEFKYKVSGTVENPNAFAVTAIIGVQNVTLADGEAILMDLSAGEVRDFEFEAIKTWVGTGMEIRAYVSADPFGSDLEIKSGFRFSIEPCGKHYYEGDIIPVAESVDPSYTFLAFLEGLAHMGYKFKSQRALKTVEIYPPEPVDIFGDSTEGFYRPENLALDWSEKFILDSEKQSIPQDNLPEKLIISFRASSDKYIESLNLPDDEPLYSKTLTFDRGIKGEPDTSENPFFEPTSNYQWGEVNVPAMWDNDQEERSFKIGPRILIGHGDVIQVVDDQIQRWKYMGNASRAELPYASQVPGVVKVDIPFAALSHYIVYGSDTHDLWEMFLQYDNRFLKNVPQIDLLMFLENADYHNLNFRDHIWFYYLGRPTIFRIMEVRDFQSEERIPTPMIVIPKVNQNNC